ncbi:MAG: alanine racemase, partial [Kiritimatiellae bacterium]|nr:alanine racemase [Kiritimatiellia bacterium]
EHIGAEVKLYPAVKADCYGHGLELLLDVISECSDGLCVAAPSEAMRLRRLGYDGPVLAFFSAYSFSEEIRELSIAELISADITQTVVDKKEIELINSVAVGLGVVASVHLKVDTGMLRAGAAVADIPELVDIINSSAGLKLMGLYTHFSSADEEDLSIAEKQLAIFNEAVAKSDVGDDVMLHAANSAAIMRLRPSHLDMVRPGLAVYGYHTYAGAETLPPLKPAMRVTAPLIQVKDVEAGSSCGYGLTYTFEKGGRVGRVPIGYGDGYPRSLSNKATVRINGKDIALRGRVSMDQIIVDLTELPDATVGDEVEIISDDSAALNSVENLARLAGTIPYEITCGLRSDRIEKVFV